MNHGISSGQCMGQKQGSESTGGAGGKCYWWSKRGLVMKPLIAAANPSAAATKTNGFYTNERFLLERIFQRERSGVGVEVSRQCRQLVCRNISFPLAVVVVTEVALESNTLCDFECKSGIRLVPDEVL